MELLHALMKRNRIFETKLPDLKEGLYEFSYQGSQAVFTRQYR